MKQRGMWKLFIFILIIVVITTTAFSADLILHRIVRDCATNKATDIPVGAVDSRPGITLNPTTDEQIIDLAVFLNGGYWNYACASRYQEQCINDGSFDSYYDEWCTPRTQSTPPTQTNQSTPQTQTVQNSSQQTSPTQTYSGNGIILHRIARYCNNNASVDIPVGTVDTRPAYFFKYENDEQIVDLSLFLGGTYSNYVCQSRYQEHCILDGTFDGWYEEWCEPKTNTQVFCTDSDNGKDYYKKAYIKGEKDGTNLWGVWELCRGNVLEEYYCTPSGYASESYTCPNGCSDGACLVTPVIPPIVNTTPVVNTTPILNTTIPTNPVQNNTPTPVQNTTINQTLPLVTTPVQIVPECSDTDGGVDFFNVGTVSVKNNSIDIATESDSCVIDTASQNSNQLSELSCGCNGSCITRTTIDCVNGCENGACIKDSDCKGQGYHCTSAQRGCGHYASYNLSCGNGNLVCCAGIPYCGDGVCFSHGLIEYGENPSNCPKDCPKTDTPKENKGNSGGGSSSASSLVASSVSEEVAKDTTTKCKDNFCENSLASSEKEKQDKEAIDSLKASETEKEIANLKNEIDELKKQSKQQQSLIEKILKMIEKLFGKRDTTE